MENGTLVRKLPAILYEKGKWTQFYLETMILILFYNLTDNV